jgi:hypothetical protein
MFLRFEENPNCGFMEDRVFMERTDPHPVTHVLRLRLGEEMWCPVVAMDGTGHPGIALARKVEDSGEGMCWLVYGGLWGLRLKEPVCSDPWSLDDPHQWGEGFLLLPATGVDLRFE